MRPAARVTAFLRHVLLAVQFFTRVPVTGRLADWVGFSQPLLRASAAHFPGVGWLVGLAACAVFAALRLALPPTPFSGLAAALGATICSVLLTGAFHEDGLADLADGLGGSHDRARALEIMKDSRIGAFGAVALVLALSAKVALLAVLDGVSLGTVLAVLLAGHVVSRFWPLLLIRGLPYVREAAGSKSKPLADRIAAGALLAAAAWCLPAGAWLGHTQGPWCLAAALAAAALGCLWMWRLLQRRLQGFTGDALGATQQVTEIAFHLGAALALGSR
ncbi:MAG TPA: adenosylcobinamide-GDP ribazoletransferase [Ramlibacter sp.]|jgi:adenosylcobinamide-GDP ribazoletransferase|uniref:adenosylcobinamide-GDP ribazoletransferase n=1 Tax=Ramlibacter sp. TaxID=1917967 RepID=UPI002D5AA4C2|nr:adenosylcobinamide-GDP ribazoletransferase [Ramlibacter sp.]HZY19712.1 adenosylcobinamide-GDP ribazoletransferase [Ramlibacter sp.]